jgi:2-keto-3-deoxy-6-phosphogluconate aldolase
VEFSAPGFGNQGRAKIMITPETGVKFENVAGIDEAPLRDFSHAAIIWSGSTSTQAENRFAENGGPLQKFQNHPRNWRPSYKPPF